LQGKAFRPSKQIVPHNASENLTSVYQNFHKVGKQQENNLPQ